MLAASSYYLACRIPTCKSKAGKPPQIQFQFQIEIRQVFLIEDQKTLDSERSNRALALVRRPQCFRYRKILQAKAAQFPLATDRMGFWKKPKRCAARH